MRPGTADWRNTAAGIVADLTSVFSGSLKGHRHRDMPFEKSPEPPVRPWAGEVKGGICELLFSYMPRAVRLKSVDGLCELDCVGAEISFVHDRVRRHRKRHHSC